MHALCPGSLRVTPFPLPVFPDGPVGTIIFHYHAIPASTGEYALDRQVAPAGGTDHLAVVSHTGLTAAGSRLAAGRPADTMHR